MIHSWKHSKRKIHTFEGFRSTRMKNVSKFFSPLRRSMKLRLEVFKQINKSCENTIKCLLNCPPRACEFSSNFRAISLNAQRNRAYFFDNLAKKETKMCLQNNNWVTEYSKSEIINDNFSFAKIKIFKHQTSSNKPLCLCFRMHNI